MIKWPTEWYALCDFWEARRARIVQRGRAFQIAAMAAGVAWVAAKVLAPSAAKFAFFAALFFGCCFAATLGYLIAQRAEFRRRSRAAQDAGRAAARQAEEQRPPDPGQCLDTPAGVRSVSSFDLSIEIPEPIVLPASPMGTLTFHPGTTLFHLTLDKEPTVPEGRDPYDPKALRVSSVVIDSQGTAWRTDTFIDPSELTGELEPPRAERGNVKFWSEVPDTWRSAMEDRVILREVVSLIDSRERFQMPVGALTLTVFNKYQGPTIDCALLRHQEDPSDRRLVVRCSNMIYEQAKDADGTEIAQGVDQVTFGYLLDAAELLPILSPQTHYRSLEEWDEADDGSGPVFRSTAEISPGAPQPNVQFTPNESV
ncbi:MAG: hypothetical protein K0U98_15625 [Deltaproteobacteria bacterium]|nr:hypothetical protein [Deltaproteobacteria bacterium]